MTQLSQNFSRAEFACKCGCGRDTVDVEVLAIAQAVRDHFAAPVEITSGHRCADHNRRVGGARTSQHIYGRAADIKVTGRTPAEVFAFVRAQFPAASVARYPTFTHVDTRSSNQWIRP